MPSAPPLPTRILVADDEEAVLEMYRAVLGQPEPAMAGGSEMTALEAELFGGPANEPAAAGADYDLVFCRQGDEAVEAVRRAVEEKRPFALAFLDVRMPPGIDGVAAAERIRELDPGIQLAIVTGYSDFDPAELAERVPPTDRLIYVQKPIHPIEVRQFASTLSARWRAERALRELNQRLEEAVARRTEELERANESLRGEMTERERAEAERRRLETQYQQAQKLESLGMLAGGIAHDFNNLMQAVLGNVDLARLDLPADCDAVAALKEVEKAAKRAAGLSQQMLTYSGQKKVNVVPLDLGKLVGDMCNLWRGMLAMRAELVMRLAPKLPVVAGDPAPLRQVLMNLVTNAVEALGDERGKISIAVDLRGCDRELLSQSRVNFNLPAGDYVCLEVSDNGCGMDEKTRELMFDPFFSTKFTGRGLGMAATLGIVRAHSGAIFVDSEPDRGTTVRILFPTAADAAAPAGSDADADAELGDVVY